LKEHNGISNVNVVTKKCFFGVDGMNVFHGVHNSVIPQMQNKISFRRHSLHGTPHKPNCANFVFNIYFEIFVFNIYCEIYWGCTILWMKFIVLVGYGTPRSYREEEVQSLCSWKGVINYVISMNFVIIFP
jgi:hypothetical protein